MRKVLPIILICILLSSCFGLFACEKAPLRTDSFLYADGTDLYLNGEKVVLTGVNAGGWLVQEGWMCPTDMTDQTLLIATLTQRFGAEKAQALLNIYMDNWWTETDFANVAAMGLNTVRLPFWYRNLYDENLQLKEDAFSRLDAFVEGAKKHGLYVILDMHGAVGSQNGTDHSGDTSKAELFTNEENMQATTRLWVEIAKHFADNTTVAAYDLLNEPTGDYKSGTTDEREWNYFDVLYKAIREVDANHVIMVESAWDPPQLPKPSVYGWTNIVYQYHFYNWPGQNDYDASKDFIESKVKMVRSARHNVPVYVGEFTAFGNADIWNEYLSVFTKRGWSWTVWTYKVVGKGSSWGLYTADLERVNPAEDSYEEIARKWGASSTAQSFERNPLLADVLINY